MGLTVRSTLNLRREDLEELTKLATLEALRPGDSTPETRKVAIPVPQLLAVLQMAMELLDRRSALND